MGLGGALRVGNGVEASESSRTLDTADSGNRIPPTLLVGATIFSTSTRSRRGIKRLAIFIEARGAECSIDAIGGCFQRRRFTSFAQNCRH